MYIPEAIYLYNVYNEKGNQLMGTGEELKLPDLQPKTVNISGSGILGDIDSPLLGMYGSIEYEVPFRTLDGEAFEFMEDQSRGSGLTIRGSYQVTDKATHEMDYKQIRVVVRGRNKGVNLGKMKQGEGMDASIKLEVTYVMIEIEGKKMLELDKLNWIYIVNGKDQLAKVRNMC